MQGRVRDLVINLDTLDASVRLFRPNAQIGVVRVKPIPRPHAGLRREVPPDDIEALRHYLEPLTTRQIARKVIKQQRVSAAGLAMVQTMRLQMATSLRKMAHPGMDGRKDGAQR